MHVWPWRYELHCRKASFILHTVLVDLISRITEFTNFSLVWSRNFRFSENTQQHHGESYTVIHCICHSILFIISEECAGPLALVKHCEICKVQNKLTAVCMITLWVLMHRKVPQKNFKWYIYVEFIKEILVIPTLCRSWYVLWGIHHVI